MQDFKCHYPIHFTIAMLHLLVISRWLNTKRSILTVYFGSALLLGVEKNIKIRQVQGLFSTSQSPKLHEKEVVENSKENNVLKYVKANSEQSEQQQMLSSAWESNTQKRKGKRNEL